MFAKTPAPPALTPPVAMPDPNDPSFVATQQAAMAKANKAGRSSTTLTTAGGMGGASRGAGQTIAGGGGAYSASKLSG